MSAWRRVAIEKIPRYRRRIEHAENIGMLWVDLWLDFVRAHADPTDEELIRQIYDYAWWCASSPDPDTSTAGALSFYEDLPLALQTASDPKQARGTWRVHFHVPIYLERFGHLLASRADILECLKAAKQYSDVKHFEVETYAWGVLPEELRQPDLAAGIAREMQWFQDAWAALARD